MLDGLKDFFKQYGTTGLFFNAFFDGFILPLPPDFLLSTLAIQKIANPTILALICSVGSVIGGCIGYCVGRFGGRKLVNKIFPESKLVIKAEKLFKKFGIWAIVIDAFTPIPYKALTLGSGLMKFNPLIFALVSFPVRSVRYVLVANTANFIGEQLRTEFENTVLLLVVFAVILITFFVFLKKRIQRMNNG
ncbi:MAG: DedA family protein [Candidatus Melainabacteria bacterium]|nr:DedA family protein [Candidatus Melainabacteria bacterium]MBI3309704.1 DedA family protein [Candidatus Melainabacteria bacterium]